MTSDNERYEAYLEMKQRRQKLRSEALRLRAKYHTSSLADLEKIAKEEYGVRKVVRTDSRDKSCFVLRMDDGSTYIAYPADSGILSRSSLAHEIGHLAAGHPDMPNLHPYDGEMEAEYFSSRLILNMPLIFGFLLALLKGNSKHDKTLSREDLFKKYFGATSQ